MFRRRVFVDFDGYLGRFFAMFFDLVGMVDEGVFGRGVYAGVVYVSFNFRYCRVGGAFGVVFYSSQRLGEIYVYLGAVVGDTR